MRFLKGRVWWTVDHGARAPPTPPTQTLPCVPLLESLAQARVCACRTMKNRHPNHPNQQQQQPQRLEQQQEQPRLRHFPAMAALPLHPSRRNVGRICLLLIAVASIARIITIHCPSCQTLSLSRVDTVVTTTTHNNYHVDYFPRARQSFHISERLPGNLTLPHLPALPYCVNVQIRGKEGILTPTQARQHLAFLRPLHDPIPTGIVTVEDPNTFVSLSKGCFHFFHFLEFVVIAFAAMVQDLGGLYSTNTTKSNKYSYHQDSRSSLAVQWWYSPLFTRNEICGAAKGINCLLLSLLWPTVQTIHGLEANTPTMQSWHEAYQGILEKRTKWQDANNIVDTQSSLRNDNDDDHQQAITRHAAMLDAVDVLLLVDRAQCKQEQTTKIHKIWTNYLDSFPAHAWHRRLSESLVEGHTAKTGLTEAWDAKQALRDNDNAPNKNDPLSPTSKLAVGYIDRQATKRRIPDTFHNWLIQYLRRHPQVTFYHLSMERYSALAQIVMAHELDMILGVHGNGLSHQLWMKPESFVMEFYWNFGFHYDYPSSAMLMNHSYQGLFNGNVLDKERIAHRDPTMLQCCTERKGTWNESASKAAVQDFVEGALLAQTRSRHEVAA